MKIERHNIFELIGRRQNQYHSAVLTSYTFDPIFFESFYLPRLRQCGITNVVVLLDASNYDRMLSRYTAFGIHSDRRLYTPVRQTPTSHGVFHPKISLFLGEDSGMLVMGSGNLTYNGQALNEEVWNTFSLKGRDSIYLPLFRSAWDYLNNLNLPDSVLLRRQLRYIKDNVEWLPDDIITDTDKVTVGHEKILFLSNDSAGSILKKLQELIGKEKVISITTVSPFYDTSGQTVKTLKEVFNPDVIKCVYSETGIYPYDLMRERPEWLSLYSWDDVFSSKRPNVHNLHAKIVQFELPSGTVLLSGSANVTNAAFNGAGDEACIAIVTDRSKDYIKDLDIILDKKTVVNPTKLEALIRKENKQEKLTPKGVHIVSAEVVDNILNVIFSHDRVSGYRLQILDSKGSQVQSLEIASGCKNIQFKEFLFRDCIAVLIDNYSREVSNRCFIINEEDVEKHNPNKAWRKLGSLLEPGRDWKVNIDYILSSLQFDDNLRDNSKSSKGPSGSIKKEAAAQSVANEEFDNIRYGSRQAVISIPNVHIADFLLASVSTRKGDEYEGTDDADIIRDIDNGDNEYHTQNRLIKSRKQEREFIECINNYGRRLKRYYDFRLTELYSKAKTFGDDIFKEEFHNATQYVNVKDYSLILADVLLIFKELNETVEKNKGNIRQYFIPNVGKFLLLARKGYENTHDYAWRKCVEYHKALIVYGLLTIASQTWYGNEVVDIKLIILNLFKSCSEPVDLDEVTELFKKNLNEMNVVAQSSSLALIDKALAEYKLFRLHLEDKTTIREVDLDNPDGNYSYRNRYGFFYVTDMRLVHQSILNNTVHEISLYHPGFNEKFTVLGSNKICALS